MEEGAVEEETGLVPLGLPPGVVEGTGLVVGGLLPPEDGLPPEVGCDVGESVLLDEVLLPVGDVVWPPWVELSAGVVSALPVELGDGALVGPTAVNLSFEA